MMILLLAGWLYDYLCATHSAVFLSVAACGECIWSFIAAFQREP
jgi:hypothetical protein